MSEVTATAINPADVQKGIETIKKLVKIGKVLAALTPTTIDDKVIDVIDRVVSAVEPFAQDDMIVQLLSLVTDLFKKDPKVAVAALKAAMSA